MGNTVAATERRPRASHAGNPAPATAATTALRELALFDFDHTLTDRDSYARFLRRVATPERRAQAWWRVGPWLLAYRLKLISAERIRRRVTMQVLRDRHLDDIATQAQAYARDDLPAMLRPDMMEQLRWHKAQGHTVAIVSASLDLYLRPWCEQLGLELICNTLETDGNRLTGRYAGGDIGRHKAARIRSRYDLAGFHRIHAYGDSAEDKPMLALAHVRWWRGKPVAQR